MCHMQITSIYNDSVHFDGGILYIKTEVTMTYTYNDGYRISAGKSQGKWTFGNTEKCVERSILERPTYGQDLDVADSGSYPMASFGICGIKSSSSDVAVPQVL